VFCRIIKPSTAAGRPAGLIAGSGGALVPVRPAAILPALPLLQDHRRGRGFVLFSQAGRGGRNGHPPPVCAKVWRGTCKTGQGCSPVRMRPRQP